MIEITMNEVIARATNYITEILEEPSHSIEDHIKSQLIDIRQLLNRLLESDSPRNDWSRQFCRQLNRLMDYNESLPEDFWIQLRYNILYILQESSGEQNVGNNWKHFSKKMEFELELERRALQFQQAFGERKTLHQLLIEYRNFFEKYLQKCISLHSKIQVRGLVDNMDDFLQRNYELTEVLVTSESRKHLEEKLKCIEIDFDGFDRLLQSICYSSAIYDKTYTIDNDNLDNFFPSAIPHQLHYTSLLFSPHQELRDNRWIVILGDPGSAKTTLLRWITRVFATAAHNGDEEIVFQEGYLCAVRIPILIRIGEFATWLKEHQTKTLMDYIGKHTWFSQPYSHVEERSLWKELISHGHALILLDGLDEISDVIRRQEIVSHVRKFIDEYVRAPDFISAFDDATFFDPTRPDSMREIVETQPVWLSGGNQIVVTSRVIGYQLNALAGPFIKHYSLSPMDGEEIKKFASKWVTQVNHSIVEALSNERIELNEEIVESLSKRRHNSVQAIFEIGPTLIMSNPAILSLICMSVFKSRDVFHPKTRVEVYDYVVQSAVRSCASQQLIISENILINFLIDLAFYLHLHSPSGLIDEFDMQRLCCLSLQQQGLSNDRIILREHMKKLLSSLNADLGIVAERGLQVFSFVHLSFQEYFVAQSFVREFSIDKIVKRILTFTIDVRFRESLLLALGWISWKRSSDDYDNFCNLLVTPTIDYAIPFGTLLFFDAFNDIQKLPSNSVIFTALNSLIDHPSDLIVTKYFIWSLFKLRENIILEWMQSRLQDDKFLTKFCYCLLTKVDGLDPMNQIREKSLPSAIYQQLWLSHNIGASKEFVIDQTLRKIFMEANAPDSVFNKTLCSYFSSHEICASNIHPLVLSVLIAVCGGISFKNEKKLIKIHFSPKQMHRESSIVEPIIGYFTNNNEPHSTKIQTLIKQYDSVLEKSSLEDVSLSTVDIFVALICLQGFLQPLIYQKYDGYQALPLALARLKRIWFYLRESFSCFNNDNGVSSIMSEVESIMNMFSAQTNQFKFDEQSIALYLVCAAACKKLGIGKPLDWLNFRIFRLKDIDRYLECQSEFSHSFNKRKLNQIVQNIHPLQIFQKSQLFLLTFVPQSLQQLYYCLTIAPTNNIDSLPPVILLSQCLMVLEGVNKSDLNYYLALSILQAQFKEHMLENYASVLFWEKNSTTRFENSTCKEFLDAMRDHKLADQLIYRSIDLTTLINVERQRICQAKIAMQNQEVDSRFFAASVSLTKLFQTQYTDHKYNETKTINLSSAERNEVYLGIINIRDPVLRIIALSVILDLKDPPIFDEKQRDQLRWKMNFLLQSILPNLPLLTSTLLFVRCHILRQIFPASFKYMATVMGRKLNKISLGNQRQDQEAAYIALRQLNNSDLSPCLSEFAKRTRNLSDLLQFNSTIFFRYFNNTTSFDTSNTVLLSTMYLAELAFDAQIQKMYTGDDHMSEILPLQELKQLWSRSSKNENIMTFEVAKWITNYLQVLNKEELHQIKKDVSHCVIIERKSLLLIKKWISYRRDENLKFFAHYATLQLIMHDSNIVDLTDIIREIFDSDNKFYLISIVKYLLPTCENLTIVEQILTALNQDAEYSSEISFSIYYEQMLDLILKLELKRATSDTHQLPETSSTSFLFMISDCSQELQLYLKKHLFDFVNTQYNIQDAIKEKYLTIIIEWLILSSARNTGKNYLLTGLYDYIFEFLRDHRFPLVQKTILNGLNRLFTGCDERKKCVFTQDNTVTHLEYVINSWDEYSQDVLSTCLLAYGNCLLMLKELQIDRNVSDDMQHVLINHFKTSSSEIISIRAAFCLIFAQNSTFTPYTILDWFRNKLDLTYKKEYSILLQQALYQNLNWFLEGLMDQTVSCIQRHSVELLTTFVDEFYDYLSDKVYSNSDIYSVPNYIGIAVEFIMENSEAFRDAVQKSSFGEEMFRRKLYLYCVNKKRYCTALIKLYTVFGVVTADLVDMLGLLKHSWGNDIWKCLKKIKKVSDRDVIDKLFELLDKYACSTELNHFSDVLRLLVQLARVNVTSLSEVHQQFSLVMDKMSYKYDDRKWYNQQQIFSLFLNLSSIKAKGSSPLQKNMFTETDIDKYFEREIQDSDNRSTMFLRRHYFLNILQSTTSNFD